MAPVHSRLLENAFTPHPHAVRSSTHAALLRSLPFPSSSTPPLNHIIPGVPLTTQLPKPNHSDPRGSVRLLLTELLVFVTGDRCARMWWTAVCFQKHVVLRYGVLLVGWPPDVPFMNFSPGHGSPSMAQLRRLLGVLGAKPQPRMYFVRAAPEQLRAAQLDVAAAIPGPLFPAPVPLPYVGRSNIGRRSGGGGARRNADGIILSPRYVRDGPTSAKVIGEELDSEASGWASVRAGPLPQMFKDGAWLIWGASGWRLPTTSELLGPSNAGWDGVVF